MKKVIALALAAVMALSMVACGGGETGGETATAGKVAIITGTVTQGEEDFQAAEKMKAKYPDRVITATYPDNFDKETETVISNVVSLVLTQTLKFWYSSRQFLALALLSMLQEKSTQICSFSVA